LHGTAEALWRPNLEGDELVEICGRAFVSALERDCYSGYGAVVYLIQAKGRGDSVDDDGEDEDESDVCIMEYVISCRND
jgi:20S proteasome alpha/beta subunit